MYSEAVKQLGGKLKKHHGSRLKPNMCTSFISSVDSPSYFAKAVQGILLLLFVCVFYVLFIIRCNIAFVY